MTDLEKWKQWLDSWKIKYEVKQSSYAEEFTYMNVDPEGRYCYIGIEFETNSGSFLRIFAAE